MRKALDNLFKSVGFDVELFASPQEFLQSTRADRPGCIVLDVRFPGRSGLDMQRELAQINAPLPIIFITGYGDIPMSVRAMKAGAVEFLTKPFRDQDLLDAVGTALERDRVRRAGETRLSELRSRFATLTAREGAWAQITLPSGEVRRVSAECRATIGSIGNADHMNISLGKAGRKRWLGRKPHNRGTAQNPVSHPMGGGEGRSKGGRHPCSPTGVLAKGGKTRKKRKPSNSAIIRRRRPGPHYATS